MGACGVAMRNLLQKELEGSKGCEHAIAPEGIADLLTCADDGLWLQLGRLLCFESAQYGGDAGYHHSTSCVRGDHRPFPTGDTMIGQH
jgi:hypothetical protein